MSTVIGLTGGTGCGKSAAAEYLQKKGAVIIDADRIAREITEPGQPALLRLAAAFPGILQTDGSLNRKKLGTLVFSDSEALERLNGITHAYIINEIEKRLAASSRPLTVIDAPLLLECGLERLCDCCIAVLADRSLRLQRIIERDHLTEEEAFNRIASQPEDSFYRSRCRFILENNSSLSALEQALDDILKELAP